MKCSTLILLAGFCVCATTLSAQSYTPEWNNKKTVIKPSLIETYSFPLQDVTLLESPFKTAMQKDAGYLLSINPDRLLAQFRSHAGLQPKGERYGGWESDGLAGHSLGHYLSALSLHYAATGDKDFLQRINYIVSELDECQKARKSGYLGAIPKEDTLWAEVANGHIKSRGFDLNGMWSPWYTVHKIMAGLADAYVYGNNARALSIDEGMADWTANTIKNLNDSLLQKMLVCEYGGMADVLTNLYELTGKKKYLDLSYRFYDKRILDSLALGYDILSGKHSNTQIPKVIASARRYQLIKDKRDSAIAHFFWNTIVHNHSYATGGNSNYEYLGPARQLNDKLTDNTTETCNTYNMLKLTKELFMLRPSSAYMDYYEKALYNHILASQNHNTAMTTYFVSLRMGGRKEYSDSFNTFTCCVGTGMENHVKYGESIYFRGKDGSLYINLFIPSVLNWREKATNIKQETSLTPENVLYTITTAKPSMLTIRIRKPYWSKNASIKVNGIKQAVSADENGYMVLRRTWKNNDKIELLLPTEFYTEAMPDNKNRKAIFYGPVLLAGILGNKEPEPSQVPVLVSEQTDANKWLQFSDKKNFVVATNKVAVPKDVQVIPFNHTADEYYTVYWDVFTPAEWTVQQKKYEEEKRKQKALEDATTDYLRVGEMQPERDHNLVGEKIITGDDHNRKWRMAQDSGYFSFTMKVDPNETNTLICTYWGEDNRGRIFDIFINDTKIATEDLTHFKMSKFYDIGYSIPKEATSGKSTATIKFIPRKNNSAGPVYGIRMAKGDVTSLLTPLTNESIYK